MRNEMSRDLLLVGEIAEVRGTKVKVRVYSQANEASVFYCGEIVRGVSVGGIPVHALWLRRRDWSRRG